jgi:aminodeoxychorismate lyase
MEQANSYNYLNGKIILSKKASILTNDRGFLYGDGLYETIRIHQGKPFLWKWHMTRLIAGAEIIGLKLPLTSSKLLEELKNLIQKNNSSNCIARLTITRGPGERGYDFTGDETPTSLVSLHEIPPIEKKAISLSITNIRVATGDILTTIKSNNKLGSIMAKRFAKEKNTDDGLIINSDGNITETSSANIFYIKDGILRTPPINDGVLPGVTRRLTLGLASSLGLAVKEESIAPKKLEQANAIFVTSAATGIRNVKQIEDTKFPKNQLVNQLQKAYNEELSKHTKLAAKSNGS